MSSKEQILALLGDDVEQRKILIQKFVMDKTNSYEDRLEVYKATPEHLQYHDNWIFHHPTMQDKEWLPNWMERHETWDLLTIIEIHDGWDEDTTRKFLEGCMDAGVWSFEYDW